jgi:hypothetical protein
MSPPQIDELAQKLAREDEDATVRGASGVTPAAPKTARQTGRRVGV